MNNYAQNWIRLGSLLFGRQVRIRLDPLRERLNCLGEHVH